MVRRPPARPIVYVQPGTVHYIMTVVFNSMSRSILASAWFSMGIHLVDI